MDRVTKSRPITPKMRHSYGSINSIIFSKGFLTRPTPHPTPHACNFYINFKPLSCIKLFCGREKCVWEERTLACPAPLGSPGLGGPEEGRTLCGAGAAGGLQALLGPKVPSALPPALLFPDASLLCSPPRAALPVPIHRWAPKLLNVLFVSLELENLIFWRSEK